MSDEIVYEAYAIRFATNPARRRGQDFIGDPDPSAPHTMDFYCWLVVGGGEAIMVDTGTTRESVAGHGFDYIGCPTEALAALGFDAGQVRTVIVTHLHYDHIGNLDRFPQAHFFVPEAEMRFATGPDMQAPFIRRPYGARETGRVVDYLYQGRVTLHGDTMEVRPGLSVHVVGGHTAGQSIVRVRTRRGWVVLASDALHYYEELERGIPFAVVHDMSRMLAAHATIRALADSDAHVVPAHDPLVLQRYPAVRPELAGILVRLDTPHSAPALPAAP